ncbi:MAG: succinylglutamate desuccinylase/aspartoacylase family protein [Bacteroidota bacterium]
MYKAPVKSKRTSKEVQRMIGQVAGKHPGPTVVFFGGIHGNEPAGVIALEKVFFKLQSQASNDCQGKFIGLRGNLMALKKKIRFVDEDLNRIWFPHRLANLEQPENDQSVEAKEMHELHQCILDILETASPPFYFIDLHTTSGVTQPFIVVNDSLLNRRFTSGYPLPVILGIEEYLTGALLSYINELGYVAFGYESGKHEDPAAIVNAENFIWYTLGLTGFYPIAEGAMEKARLILHKTGETSKRFYEIYHQYLIGKGAYFKMLPGFENFQIVPKGQAIAINGGGTIFTKKERQLFMPLYQDKGKEGFYFIRSVPRFFLWLSKYLRKRKADALLVAFPGIRWASSKKEAILVDRRIARFYAKSIFHLLGYRTREVGKHLFILKNRERSSRHSEYAHAGWLKKRS